MQLSKAERAGTEAHSEPPKTEQQMARAYSGLMDQCKRDSGTLTQKSSNRATMEECEETRVDGRKTCRPGARGIGWDERERREMRDAGVVGLGLSHKGT